MNKKGVSLVTVLLLMLVATIAGTATYKWLSSHNVLSQSRMLQSEAYLAAKAGIENTRNWMTYNGNEVGDMIRQFEKGNGAPIVLDDALKELNSSKQHFTVKLVDVDVDGANYKLKIVSTGGTFMGGKHSEVAVLNVSGLYKVAIPSNEKKKKPAPYNYAYYGGSLNNTQISAVSAVVNGDFTPAQPNISQDLVITGNLNGTSGKSTFGLNTCVGGKIDASTEFTFTNLYVVGEYNVRTNHGNINGNAYFGGKLSPSGEDVTVLGNTTIDGTFTWDDNASKKILLKKDLCLGDKALLDLKRKNGDNLFSVSGNVYIPNKNQVKVYREGNDAKHYIELDKISQVQSDPSGTIYNDAQGYLNYMLIHFGESDESQLYIEGLKNYKDKKWVLSVWPDRSDLRDCKSGDYYCIGLERDSYGYVSGHPLYSAVTTKANEKNLKKPTEKPDDMTCAQSVKDYCDDIWRPRTSSDPKCLDDDGHIKYIVDDPIVSSYESFEKYANKGCAKDITVYGESNNKAFVDQMNQCYEDMKNETNGQKKEDLYNGFLVVKLSSKGNNGRNGTLKGKFVIIYDFKLEDGFNATDENTVVMAYLRKGGKIAAENKKMNYFIFTEEDVEGSGSMTIDGSFFSPLDKCTKNTIPDWTFNFNQTVVDELFWAGILCSNDGTTCDGSSSEPASSTSSTSSESSTTDAFDSYLISVSPQLNVSIESEYKNNEEYSGKETDLSPSVLVLPRVIYMTKDPVGKLEDYYNLINLNGAKEVKTSSKVSCSPSLPTTGALYTDGNPLTEGLRTCKYSAGGTYGDIPFYVYVKGTASETPVVAWDDDFKELEPGSADATKSQVSVTLNVPVASNQQKMSVDVFVSKVPSDWESYITKSSFVQELKSDNNGKVYRVSFDTQGPMEIFKYNVTGATSLSTGSVVYQLIEPCDGCQIGAPNVMRVYISGKVDVNRKGLAEYCTNAGVNCDEVKVNGVAVSTLKDRPDCDVNGTWVSATGINCKIKDLQNPNDGWTCSNLTTVGLQQTGTNANCDVIIPTENNTVSASEDGTKSYTLYASIKKKAYDLTVKMIGASEGGEEVHLQQFDSGKNAWVDVKSVDGDDYLSSNTTKTFSIYAANTYRLLEKPGSGRFSYWSCVSGDACFGGTPSVESINITPTSFMSVEAHFNKKDKHCFYDDFTEMDKKCKNGKLDDENCVDNCGLGKNDNSSCDVKGLAESGKNWMLMYGNKPNGGNGQSGNFVNISNGTISRPNYGSNWDESEHGGYDVECKLTCKTVEASGAPTLILSRVEGGKDGQMTSIFTTDVLYKEKSEQHFRKESGFIFRSNSNATQYFSLTIYGEKKTNSIESNIACTKSRTLCSGAKIIAKLCQVNGLKVANPDNQCVAKELTASVENEFFKYLNREWILGVPLVLNMTVKETTVDVRVKLTRSIIKTDDDLYASFDLTDSKFSLGTFNDNSHQYVGFKLAAKEFTLKDLGWYSETYKDDGCFSNPTLMCSFAQNYADGRVPINQNVSPWYSTSAFSMGAYKDCSIDFFYNGCDNSTSSNNCSVSSKGLFYKNGEKLNNDSGTYNFSKEGLHGYYETDNNYMVSQSGYAYDAKVQMNCDGANVTIPSSLYNPTSCGEFYVGETEPCSENIELVSSSQYCSSGTCTIDLGSSKNLRDAAVNLTFEDYAMSGTVSFMDERNNESEITTISSSTQRIELSSVKNSSFDPQLVRYIVVRPNSGASVTVKYANSACPNALNISGCNASYDGSKWWTFTASVNAGDQCRVESVSDGGANTSSAVNATGWEDCATGLNRKVDDPISNLTAGTYKFKYSIRKGTDDSKIETCYAGPVDVREMTANCWVSNATAVAGTVPTFNYGFSNCPSGSFTYTVEVGDQKHTVNAASCRSDESWAPQNLAAGNYTYKLKVGNREMCSKTFSITQVSVDGQCSINGDLLIYSVSGVNGANVPVKIGTADALGNVLDVSVTNNVTNGSVDLSQKLTTPGTYTLSMSVGGATKACGSYTVAAPASSSSSAVSSSSQSQSGNLSVTCGVSNNQNGLMSGSVYSTQNLYFIMKNNTNEQSTYNVSILKNGSQIAQNHQVNNWTQWSNYSLGNLSIGHYTFEVQYNGSVICSDAVDVSAPTATCYMKKGDAEVTSGTAGESYTINIKDVEGIYNNLTLEWYLGSTKIKDVDCGTSNCWNNSSNLTSPGGMYSLKYGGQEVCSVNFSVTAPQMTAACSFASASVKPGTEAKFKVTNVQNGSGNHLTLYDNNSNSERTETRSDDNDFDIAFNAPNTEGGPYTYTLKDNDNRTICSANLSVSNSTSGGGSQMGNVVDYTGETWFYEGVNTIRSCNGSTGEKTLQFYDGSWNNCGSIFGTPSYWSSGAGACAGQLTITLPLTFTVPSGQKIRVANCY